MKYAIFSDVQGNYPRLESFLEDSQSEGVDSFICLGDIVQKGASFDDNRCIDLIRGIKGITIRGNHEEEILKNRRKSLKKIYPANLDFLATLPFHFLLEQKYLLSHKPHFSDLSNGKVLSPEDAQAEFEFLMRQYPNVRVSFLGHSHKAFLFEYDPKKRKVEERDDLTKRTMPLINGKLYLANPGGIGLYYGVPNSYLIFDTDKSQISFKQLK